jgi:hypothetical protein
MIIKHNLIGILASATVFAGAFFSCVEDDPEPVTATKVLVVNAGNFGQGNGSVAVYDEETKTITNNAVAQANNGAGIGSGLQSLYFNEGTGYLICNASDKIEVIDANTLAYVANPVGGLGTPRYMHAQNGLGYITCWGPWSQNFTLDNSYLAVMDLANLTIVDSLETGSGPEGILAVDNKVYIANSYANSITVYDADFQNAETIEVGASPQHFEVDGNGLLWVALGSLFGTYGQDQVGFQSINTSDNSLDTFVNIPGFSDYGEIAINGDRSLIYFFITEPFPGTATDVYTFNTNSKTASSTALISGNNFFGIGYNADSDLLYVSDAAAYQGPGKVLVYTPDGTEVDQQVTGVGPYHFVFR